MEYRSHTTYRNTDTVRYIVRIFTYVITYTHPTAEVVRIVRIVYTI